MEVASCGVRLRRGLHEVQHVVPNRKRADPVEGCLVQAHLWVVGRRKRQAHHLRDRTSTLLMLLSMASRSQPVAPKPCRKRCQTLQSSEEAMARRKTGERRLALAKEGERSCWRARGGGG